jgi:hypothetical protein
MVHVLLDDPVALSLFLSDYEVLLFAESPIVGLDGSVRRGRGCASSCTPCSASSSPSSSFSWISKGVYVSPSYPFHPLSNLNNIDHYFQHPHNTTTGSPRTRQCPQITKQRASIDNPCIFIDKQRALHTYPNAIQDRKYKETIQSRASYPAIAQC